MGLIVTIDGPAGSGKSTVARALAERLGFHYLDTGAMYRAIALAGLRHDVDWNRPDQLAEMVSHIDVSLETGRIFLDAEDVTDAVRTSEVTAVTRHAADHPEVRRRLIALQRSLVEGRNVITEGRDQGSLAFPAADVKIYLTATPEERARRRVADFKAQGEHLDLEKVLADIELRDEQDTARAVGPLVRPTDAIDLVTDRMTLEEVVERLASFVRTLG